MRGSGPTAVTISQVRGEAGRNWTNKGKTNTLAYRRLQVINLQRYGVLGRKTVAPVAFTLKCYKKIFNLN